MKPNRSPLEALLSQEIQRAKDETRAQLQGLEVQDTDFGEWLEAGGEDRRKRPRDALAPVLGRPKYL